MTRPTGPDIRVLVVDDQQVIRDGLASLLPMLGGIEVVGTAADGQLALAGIRAVRPDVLLMDLKMPVMGGLDVLRVLRQSHSAVRVVVLTTFDDDDYLFPALDSGALGFLTKDAESQEIKQAILDVAIGGAYLSPSVQRRVLARLVACGRTDPPARSAPTVPADGLTARERDVLREIARGLPNGRIADVLFVSEATVKTHINRLLSKTGCADRAGLMLYAYRTGHAALPTW